MFGVGSVTWHTTPPIVQVIEGHAARDVAGPGRIVRPSGRTPWQLTRRCRHDRHAGRLRPASVWRVPIDCRSLEGEGGMRPIDRPVDGETEGRLSFGYLKASGVIHVSFAA